MAVVVSVFVAIAALYRLYISIRMRSEIKSEVDRTLEQYYKYMDAFQDDSSISDKKSKPKPKRAEEIEEEKRKETGIEM